MEAWQPYILAQVVVSSLMTIWYRKVSLKNPQTYFLVALILYFTIASFGLVFALIANDLELPELPNAESSRYIILAGSFIAVSWLVNFKLLSNIGALSMSIASSLNFVMTALFGVFILNEHLSIAQVIGAIFLCIAVIISIHYSSATGKPSNAVGINLLLVLIGSIFLASGLLFEKISIDHIGVWSYVFYGWSMQFIAALVLFLAFGRNEVMNFKDKVLIKNSFKAGFITVIAGLLFVYSLSQGLLSSVVLSASAKISLTAVLAVLILKERSNLKQRLLALFIALIGLLFMFS